MVTTRSRLYTDKWRDKIRSGVQSSAAVLCPMLVEAFEPKTAIDVGCGEGWFVRELEQCGVNATGVDGAWVDGVQHVDLTAPPYPELGRFDMALCLEVAEHVPARCARDLVRWLVSLAPIVVFSAALPGQGGTGHVNEQWPAYWRDLFAAERYQGTGGLRPRIWDDERVEGWYRNNLLVFIGKDDASVSTNFDWDGCPSLVHPYLWKLYGHG